MRYANSVEDRVRRLLSERLENISRLFGQLPDTLEDVWVRDDRAVADPRSAAKACLPAALGSFESRLRAVASRRVNAPSRRACRAPSAPPPGR